MGGQTVNGNGRRADDKIKIHSRSSKYLRNKFAFNCIWATHIPGGRPQNTGRNQIKSN